MTADSLRSQGIGVPERGYVLMHSTGPAEIMMKGWQVAQTSVPEDSDW